MTTAITNYSSMTNADLLKAALMSDNELVNVLGGRLGTLLERLLLAGGPDLLDTTGED